MGKKHFSIYVDTGGRFTDCIAVDNIVSFLEFIEFFDNGDGNDNVVVFELMDAGAVVKYYIGVQNKDFFHRQLLLVG